MWTIDSWRKASDGDESPWNSNQWVVFEAVRSLRFKRQSYRSPQSPSQRRLPFLVHHTSHAHSSSGCDNPGHLALTCICCDQSQMSERWPSGKNEPEKWFRSRIEGSSELIALRLLSSRGRLPLEFIIREEIIAADSNSREFLIVRTSISLLMKSQTSRLCHESSLLVKVWSNHR